MNINFNIVSDRARRWLIVLFTVAAIPIFAQTPAPSLEQIKIAADAGDPAAQDKLAEQYLMRLDSKDAELWYRKSANQGYAHAQGQLGDMLLMRSKTSVGLKPEERANLGDEALKWLLPAANQGDVQGQADMAGICLDGKLVKQDLIEAYKWGDLAASGGGLFNPAGIAGQSTRNAAVLKMDADQIAEAKRRVAAFVPHPPDKSELPQPAWMQKIKLQGISGTADNRLAIINGKTLAKGDAATLKIDGNSVTIHCLEVRESSVSISIEGVGGTRELSLTGN